MVGFRNAKFIMNQKRSTESKIDNEIQEWGIEPVLLKRQREIAWRRNR